MPRLGRGWRGGVGWGGGEDGREGLRGDGGGLWSVESPQLMNLASLHFTYPIVYLTVVAPRMIGQPLFSILLYFWPFKGLHPTLILSTPLRCPTISSPVHLSLSLPAQCLAGPSLQVPPVLFCAHTISVFVSSQR